MIGDDQGDLFDEANNPTFSVYTGEEPLWGRSARDSYDTPPAERTKLVFKPHPELSRHLHRGLVKRGFDMASIGRFDPRGNPTRGVSHMVSNLVPEVDPGLEIPLMCVFMNEYYPPLPERGPLRAPGRGHRRRPPRSPGAHRDLRLGRPLPLPGHVQRGLDRPAARPVDPRAARAQRPGGDGASLHLRLRRHALRHGRSPRRGSARPPP